MKSLLTAISLLTIFPVPQKWANSVSTSSIYFPLVGFILGTMYYALAYAMSSLKIPAEWISLAVLCAMIIFTRAFHLDGLADMADGFWGGHTKERILSIMKDSATGVFGVMALILMMLIKWTALNNIMKNNDFWILIPVVIISRAAITVAAGLFPYARKQGTGHAVISNTSLKNVAVMLIYSLPLLIIFFGIGSLIVVLTGLAISISVSLYSYNKIDGITGDVLGAVCEISEALLLVLVPYLNIHLFHQLEIPLFSSL